MGVHLQGFAFGCFHVDILLLVEELIMTSVLSFGLGQTYLCLCSVKSTWYKPTGKPDVAQRTPSPRSSPASCSRYPRAFRSVLSVSDLVQHAVNRTYFRPLGSSTYSNYYINEHIILFRPVSREQYIKWLSWDADG